MVPTSDTNTIRISSCHGWLAKVDVLDGHQLQRQKSLGLLKGARKEAKQKES